MKEVVSLGSLKPVEEAFDVTRTDMHGYARPARGRFALVRGSNGCHVYGTWFAVRKSVFS